MVWSGEIMRGLMAQIERVAASETRVSILGETGTGKELVARTLHEKSPRHAGPFVTLNCAAVPAELIESELFGHEKGAFTGAGARHLGKFEQAQHGTLLLDEIGDMPLAMQAKLLRVLEEGEIERVGGDRPVQVDVRVVVATHRNLEDLVKQGKFRQDLYHRVYVFPLTLPPLRERQEDITALVDHFARQVAAQNGWKPIEFAPEAIEELKQYGWPGNVRELRNVVERLLLLTTNDCVEVGTVRSALPVAGTTAVHVAADLKKLGNRVEAFERESILAELGRNQNHITNTAHALGLERSYLYKKCQQLGIDLRALRKEE
jgi:DNA-binding NtrC family response regulator